MASFSWLLWNQIMLFEELSRGDTCGRICRDGYVLLEREHLLQRQGGAFSGGGGDILRRKKEPERGA